MLADKIPDGRIPAIVQMLATGPGMIFPGFKAAGFGYIMQQGGRLD